jgi:hypothetical protein
VVASVYNVYKLYAMSGGGRGVRSGEGVRVSQGRCWRTPGCRGPFLSEQDLADRIGVSRTPIREALLHLAAEDLVELVPKRGARVAPLTGREIRELMEPRGIVERYAAERLVSTHGRRAPPSTTTWSRP